MSTLLDDVLAAAGDADRWAELTELSVTLDVGGGMWASMGQEGVLAGTHPTVRTREQRVSFAPFGDPNTHGVYTPGLVRLTRTDGTPIAGFVLPTRRRVVPRDPADGTTPDGPVLASIDIADITAR
ncbi:hypothetical protein ACTMSW_08305 [Micromonospora sp. BQ11]|uniref:hypothetical protein n=1 Tax=Micromonospora sp. BQ11 TaxID=3452212 RepID=UPI003F893D06